MKNIKNIEAKEEKFDEEQDEKEPLDPFVLEILLKIFRKVFNVKRFFSKEDLQLTPENFIEKIMNNEMKDITKEDSLTIMERKTAINNESFNQAIKKDLKYILSHYSKSVIVPNRNNKYRYLICFSLLESMYDSTNELPNKTIKELQIFLLNGFLDKTLSTEEALIRMALFIGNFCGNAYYDQIKKEFEESIKHGIENNNMTYIINYIANIREIKILIKRKEENDEKYEEQLRADKYEKELLLYKNKRDSFKISLMQEIYNWMITYQIVPAKIDELVKFLSEKTCLQLIQSIIISEDSFSLDDIKKYNGKKSMYYEIDAILQDMSFQQFVYDILSSKIIKNYYTFIPKEESELKTKEDKEKEEDRKRIMNEIIVQSYNDLLNEIENKERRAKFFKQTFCLMNLPHNLRGATNRYLYIALNYSDIQIKQRHFVILVDEDDEDYPLINKIPKEKRTMNNNNDEILLIRVIL